LLLLGDRFLPIVGVGCSISILYLRVCSGDLFLL
jgi:hypothetical protein